MYMFKNETFNGNDLFFKCVQVGYLDVVVPPDFINEETSGDVMVPEGGTVKLACRARGYPDPHVLWRREDGHEIIIRESNGHKTKGMYSTHYFSFHTTVPTNCL